MPNLTPEQFGIGMRWLDKATGLDPSRAKVYTLFAIFRSFSHLNDSFKDGEGHELERAEAAALKSVRLGPDAPDGYWSLSVVHNGRGSEKCP